MFTCLIKRELCGECMRPDVVTSVHSCMGVSMQVRMCASVHGRVFAQAYACMCGCIGVCACVYRCTSMHMCSPECTCVQAWCTVMPTGRLTAQTDHQPRGNLVNCQQNSSG